MHPRKTGAPALAVSLVCILWLGLAACGDAEMQTPSWYHGYHAGGSQAPGGGSPAGGTSNPGGGSNQQGGDGGQQPQLANFGLTLDKTSLKPHLASQSQVTATVSPNGYAGPVHVAIGTLPSGVAAKLDHDTLTLDGSTLATATATVTIDSSAPPGATNFEVTVTGDGATKTAPVAVDVQPVITIHIPKGVDNLGGTLANPYTTAYGPYPIRLTAPPNLSAQNPVTIYFFNDDSVSHELHAGQEAQGFGHDPGPIPPQSMDPYVRRVNAPGTYDWYLHDQGAPITPGQIVIQ